MLSAMALFVVVSCSKSKEEPKEQAADCQLMQASVSGGGETITNSYEYNNGKITIVKSISVFNNGSPISKNYSYNYTSTSISHMESNYSLDAQGRIKNQSGSDHNGNFTKIYVYNNDGYLTEIKKDNTNEVTKYTWTNGNLTKIEEVYSSGGTSYIHIEFYEYGTELKPANFYADVPDLPIVYDYTFRYMGKQSKNLVSKIRYENGASSDIYSYGKDDKGNITSITQKEEGTLKTWSVYEFKYNCK